jgi:hypothetical protein
MSDMNPSDAAAVEDRLKQLQARLAETASQSSRRLTVTSLVMAGLLVGAFFYLRFIASSITTYAEAPTLVELVAAQVEPRLQEAPAELAATLKARAPEVVGQAEKLLLDALPQLTQQADEFLVSFFEREFKNIESEAAKLIREAFDTVVAKAREKNIDLAKEGELEKAVAQSAPTLREMAETLIQANFEKYSDGADGVAAYIDRIATSSDLTDHEQSQKQVLITGLALLQKMEKDKNRAPIQSILEGRIPADSPVPVAAPR